MNLKISTIALLFFVAACSGGSGDAGSEDEAVSYASVVEKSEYFEGFFDVYQDITGTIPVRGNLVPDAHLVSLLRQHDIQTLYSTDTDFRKFAWLTVKNPLVETSK
jgi:predicted nucleic acid-binding protein